MFLDPIIRPAANCHYLHFYVDETNWKQFLNFWDQV